MSSTLEQLKALIAGLGEDERKELAAIASPAVAIKPADVTLGSYTRQGESEPTSIRLACKPNKQTVSLYVSPAVLFAILANADELALAAADAVEHLPASKMPEGKNSWKAAFEGLAETLGVLEGFRKPVVAAKPK